MKILNIYNIIDSVIVSLLILSTGGLLFVFNRNLCYAIFIFVLFFAILFSRKKYRTKEVSSAILTGLTILFLFCINYFSAVSNQVINKYAYYFTVCTVSILTLLYFRNRNQKDILINKVYFVLKLILYHAVLNFFAYFIFKHDLTTISSVNNDYETLLNTKN